MAEIIVGVACSHSPQLSTPVDLWYDHAARDRRNQALVGVDGLVHAYDGLPALPGNLADQLTDQVFDEKYDRMQAGLAKCRLALESSSARVAVVIGNDHKEMFGDDGMPAFAVYLGETVPDNPIPEDVLDAMAPSLQPVFASYYHGSVTENYVVQQDLAWHVTAHLSDAGFDPAQLSCQPPDRTLGHAWTYSRRALMGDVALPMVPVHLNSMYPPNQPSPARCYAFGRALGDAIRSWESDEPVAVITTGGLSHFVVDEQLDHEVLGALMDQDADRIASLDKRKMNSGTSEILNWITAAGALNGLAMEVFDYVPAFRTEAGTGVGMGFASWH